MLQEETNSKKIIIIENLISSLVNLIFYDRVENLENYTFA